MTDYIGKSSIKINRACALANTGRYPGTCAAMVDHIPAELRTALTGAQLALVIDSLAKCAGKSKAIATRDAIQEGGIWDANKNKMRELKLIEKAA